MEAKDTKEFSEFGFRAGDTILIPTCQGNVELSFVIRKGKRKVRLEKEAGARIKKPLTQLPENS